MFVQRKKIQEWSEYESAGIYEYKIPFLGLLDILINSHRHQPIYGAE